MGAFNRIVFFSKKGFLSAYYYEELDIDLFLQNGFEVEFWDFSHVLIPWAAKYIEEDVPDQVDFAGKRVFHDAEEIKHAISTLDTQTVVVNLVRLNLKTKFIYRALTVHRIFYMVRDTKTHPHAPSLLQSRNLWDRPMQRWMREAVRTVGLPFLEAHLRWGIKPANLALCGNVEGHKLLGRHLGKSTHILWGHTDDYDTYLDMKKASAAATVDRDFVVFIDQYVPFHLDMVARKMTHYATADVYYPRLVAFFEHIEAISGCEIIIAAHPKANYEKHPDYFGERQVMRGKTPWLIRDARFVISHASTALSFAVLFQKPVLFVTTDELDASPHGVQTRFMARLLGKSVINIDEAQSLNLDAVLSVDPTVYKQFQDAYIKMPGTSNKRNGERLNEYLRQCSRDDVAAVVPADTL